MTFTEHPRFLARVAGAFYLIITAFALFAYLYVRGHVIVPGDMAQTATNILAHERLYRLGGAAAVVVVVCNLPLGWILFELLKVVNSRLALLALLFITGSATIEAVNLSNYFAPLLTLTLPAILGLLMIVAGVTYWINSFRLFLALPIPYLPWVTLVAELSLALWLVIVGVKTRNGVRRLPQGNHPL